MIQLYNPNNTNFSANGNITLRPISVDIHPILNGAWILTMEHPIDDLGRWQYLVEGAIIKAPFSTYGEQLYRIKTVERRETEVTITAEPKFLDAKDNVFIVDKRPTNKTGQEALDILTEGTIYSGESNITKQSTMYVEYKNLIEAINGGGVSFVARWGGQIIYDNDKIIINERAGGDYGLKLHYGHNIPHDGFVYSVDTRQVVTRIYPKAYNGYTMTDNGYVDSPLIDNYPVIKTATITFDNVKMVEDVSENDTDVIICNNQEELNAALTNQCMLQYEAGIDVPIVNMQIDLAMLTDVVGYEEFRDLVQVGLGDTVHCTYEPLGITTDATVIELNYDAIGEQVTKVVLGDFKYNYFSNVTSVFKRVAEAIRPDGTVMAEQVQGFIDGALAQLRLQNTIAKKQDVRAILFEDLDPNSPTFGAMALGTQGFQISRQRTQDGREWDWTTSATAAGIIANTIVAGLLTDKLGKNYWNLDTGEFSLQGATITNSTVDGYATDTELQNAVDDLQSQIDGKVDTWFYSGAPALNKPPVTYDGSDPDTGWGTDEVKRNHIGDVYYDTTNGYAYRFIYENGAFSWMLIQDSDVTEALETAREALALADTKMKVFITQPKPPYEEGDIYFVGANGDILTCIRARATGSYNASDWAKRNKYIDTAQVSTLINTFNQSLDQQAIFNKLTNNGQTQGIYLQDGKIYINGEYIQAGVISGIEVTSSGTTEVAQNEFSLLPNKDGDYTVTSNVKFDNGEFEQSAAWTPKDAGDYANLILNVANGRIYLREIIEGSGWPTINEAELGPTGLAVGGIGITPTKYTVNGVEVYWTWPVIDNTGLEVDVYHGYVDYVESVAFAQPGDALRFSGGPFAGLMADGNRLIRFYLPSAKYLGDLEFNTYEWYADVWPKIVGVQNGKYLNNLSAGVDGSLINFEPVIYPNGVQVNCRLKSGAAFTNVSTLEPIQILITGDLIIPTKGIMQEDIPIIPN